MSKTVKRIIALSISLILILVLLVMWKAVSRTRGILFDFNHRDRLIECKPEDLITDLEAAFDINFPAEIKEVKAARRGAWDSTNTGFVIKFTADPNIVKQLFGSMKKWDSFGTYNPEDDTRTSCWKPPPPKWFTVQIQEGRICTDRAADMPSMTIFIDTTERDRFVIYLHGIYPRKLEELKQEGWDE